MILEFIMKHDVICQEIYVGKEKERGRCKPDFGRKIIGIEEIETKVTIPIIIIMGIISAVSHI